MASDSASLAAALEAVGLGRSLQRLFADYGTTPEAVAASLPFAVDATLFYRVDSQRQPLPADVAEAVARALGTDVGTVNGMARLVTRERGERARRPLPPLPISNPSPFFGEQYQPQELSPYRAQRPQNRSVQLWSFGLRLDPGADWSLADRAGGLVGGALVGDVLYGDVAPCAFDGSFVWTAGPMADADPGYCWVQKLASSSPGVVAYSLAASVGGSSLSLPIDMAFEPETGRVWLADFFNATAVRLDPATMNADASVPLVVAGDPYGATGLVAVGGRMYALGVRDIAGPTEDGRLFEIDPSSATVTRVSSGASLGAAVGVAYDPDSEKFFVAGLPGNDHPTGGAAVVERGGLSSAILSLAPLSGAPSLDDGLSSILVAYGSLWASAADQKLWKIALDGRVVGWFQGPHSGFTGRRPASDGTGFLWFPDGEGSLLLFSPGDPGPELTPRIALSAPAEGAIVVREGSPPDLVP
jgi:hypothetical protein